MTLLHKDNNAMPIRVEPAPTYIVIDDDTGWTMRSGRSYPDGSSSQELTHTSRARCTIWHSRALKDDAPGRVIRMTNMVFFGPGEQGSALSKPPRKTDFISANEMYAVAQAMIAAKYNARFPKNAPFRVLLPQ